MEVKATAFCPLGADEDGDVVVGEGRDLAQPLPYAPPPRVHRDRRLERERDEMSPGVKRGDVRTERLREPRVRPLPLRSVEIEHCHVPSLGVGAHSVVKKREQSHEPVDETRGVVPAGLVQNLHRRISQQRVDRGRSLLRSGARDAVASSIAEFWRSDDDAQRCDVAIEFSK